MKTLTEFPGINLKNAARIHKDLAASGKTPEELTPALGESLKLEGDRLQFLVHSLEIVGTRLEDLKRVVVYAPVQEGEKTPTGVVQKGDHFYLVEYYPSLAKKDPERGGKDHRSHQPGKGKKKPRGNRPPKGPREARPPRAPHAAVTPGNPAEKRVIAPLTPIAPKPAAE